jgi:hypothetical protein
MSGSRARHQYVRVCVGYKRLLETSFLAGIGEILDEFGGGCEPSFAAILDRSIPDGNRQMSLIVHDRRSDAAQLRIQ